MHLKAKYFKEQQLSLEGHQSNTPQLLHGIEWPFNPPPLNFINRVVNQKLLTLPITL